MGDAQPVPPGWRGAEQAGEFWTATWAADDPADEQPGPMTVSGILSKAQAAAAWDLMQAWALQQKGQELAAGQYNLGFERYSTVLRELQGIKEAAEVQKRVKQLHDRGILGSLVQDAPQEKGEQAAAGAAGGGGSPEAAKSSRKRRAADNEVPATSPSQLQHVGEVVKGGAEKEEEEDGRTPAAPAPAGHAGDADTDGKAAKKPRSSLNPTPHRDGGEYHGITWAKQWTAQIHFQKKQLAKQFISAMEAGRDRQTLNLGGFAGQRESAVAADLGMLYRLHVSGGVLAPKALNFARENYSQVEARLLGCPTIKDCRDLLKTLRDDGTLTELSKGPRAPPPQPGSKSKLKAKEDRARQAKPVLPARPKAREAAVPAKDQQQQQQQGVGGRGPAGTAAPLPGAGAAPVAPPAPASAAAARSEVQPAPQPSNGPQAKAAAAGEGEGTPKASGGAKGKAAAAAGTAGEAQPAPKSSGGAKGKAEAAAVGAAGEAEVARKASQPKGMAAVAAAGEAKGAPVPTQRDAEPGEVVKAAAPSSTAGHPAGVSPAAQPEASLPAGMEGRGPQQRAPASPQAVAWPRSVESPKAANLAGSKAGPAAKEADRAATSVGPSKLPAAPQAGATPQDQGANKAVQLPRAPDSWAFILEVGQSWACQVGIASGKLAPSHKSAVNSAAGRYTIRVPGFTKAEAAVAADLALMYRCHVYGEDGEMQQYNFPQAQYAQHPSLVKKLLACRTAEDAKDVLVSLRGGSLIAKLAATGKGGAQPPRPAAPRQQQPGPSPPSGPRRTPPSSATTTAASSGKGFKGAQSSKGGATSQPEVAERKRGAEVVGLGIRVYWPLDDEWYPGVVAGYDPVRDRHHIKYDDGEEHHLNLSKEVYKLSKKRRTLPSEQEQDQDMANMASRRSAKHGEAASPNSASPAVQRLPPQQQKQQQQPEEAPRAKALDSPGRVAAEDSEPASPGKRRLGRELRMLQQGPPQTKRQASAEGGAVREPQPQQHDQQPAAQAELLTQHGAGPAAAEAASALQGRLPREEMEWMYAELKYMLHRTPGIADYVAQGFLSRYLQVHEAWRVQYREIKDAYDAGREDLVREWVWCALEH